MEKIKMKKTIEYCDLCGKEFNRVRLLTSEKNFGTVHIQYSIAFFGEYELLDFCDECNDRIKEFLSQHSNNPLTEKPKKTNI